MNSRLGKAIAALVAALLTIILITLLSGFKNNNMDVATDDTTQYSSTTDNSVNTNTGNNTEDKLNVDTECSQSLTGENIGNTDDTEDKSIQSANDAGQNLDILDTDQPASSDNNTDNNTDNGQAQDSDNKATYEDTVIDLDHPENSIDNNIFDDSNIEYEPTQSQEQTPSETTDITSEQSTDEVEHKDEPGERPGILNYNGIYYRGQTSNKTGDYTDGQVIKVMCKSDFPGEPRYGDIYVEGDYEYRFNSLNVSLDGESIWESSNFDGWGVDVLDDTKEKYTNILDEINGKPIKSLCTLFKDCHNLVYIDNDFTIPSTVTDIRQMFYNCESLKCIPDSLEISENISEMSSMFRGCKSLEEIPNNFVIPSKVDDISYMFYECNSLKSLPSDFYLHNGVTNIVSMLYNCYNIVELPQDFTIPQSVTDGHHIFYGCSKLERLPDRFSLSDQISDGRAIFSGCVNLRDLPSSFRLPSYLVDGRFMFKGCTSLSIKNSLMVVPLSCIKTDYMFAYTDNLEGNIYVDSEPESYEYMFYNCGINTYGVNIGGESKAIEALIGTKGDGNVFNMRID